MTTADLMTRVLAASAFALSALVIAMCASMAAVTGCAREEPIMHVETPSGDVEVDRNIDTGEVTVDVEEE